MTATLPGPESERPLDDHASVQERYGEEYYRHHCARDLPYERSEHWLEFFGRTADEIVASIGPRTVLDVGCAHGFLVEHLRARGVEAYGIDVSEYAISQVHPSVQRWCQVGSVFEPLPEGFPEHFDLVTCIEVVEHLAPEHDKDAIRRLAAWGDRVLFSSTPDDYTEPTHLNVRPQEHWTSLFAEAGQLRDFDLDASFLTAWAVAYRREATTPARLVVAYERALARSLRETAELRTALAETERRALELPVGDTADHQAHRQLWLDTLALRDEVIGAEAANGVLRARVLELEANLLDANAWAHEAQSAFDDAQHLSEQLRSSETWKIGSLALAPVRVARRFTRRRS